MTQGNGNNEQSQDLSDLSPNNPLNANLMANNSFGAFTLSPYSSNFSSFQVNQDAFEDHSSFQNTSVDTNPPLVQSEAWADSLNGMSDMFQNTPYNGNRMLHHLTLPGYTGASPLRIQQFQPDFTMNQASLLESPNTFFNQMVNLSPMLSTTPSRPAGNLRSPLKDIPVNFNSPTAAKTIRAMKSPSKRSSIAKGFTTPLKSSLTKDNIIKLDPEENRIQSPNSSPTTIVNSSAVKADVGSTMFKKEEPQSPTRVTTPQSTIKLQEIPTEPKLGTFSLANTKSKVNKPAHNTAPKFAPLNIILTNQTTYQQQAKQPSERKKLARSLTINGSSRKSKQSKTKLKRSISQPPGVGVLESKPSEMNPNIRDVFRDDQ